MEFDINHNGDVDATAIQLVINRALGLLVDFDCDLDGDNKAKATDMQMGINTVLGVAEP